MENNQHFITIEEINSIFNISEVVLDEENSLELLSQRQTSDLSDLKKPHGKAPFIILTLNSQNATTIEKEIEIKRSSSKREIDESELDRLIFKSLWSFLNEHRQFASKKMKVTDLNIILSEIEIKSVFLDSKKVMNPIGLKGKSLTFRLRGTLIPRKVLEHIKTLEEISSDIKTVERFGVIASIIPKSDFVVFPEETSTQIFDLTDSSLKFKKSVTWGTDSLTTPVKKFFSVDRTTSLVILNKFFNDQVSKKMKEEIEKMVRPSLDSLTKTIKNISRKRKIKIMVNLPKPIYNASLSKYSKAKRLDLKNVLESRGFNVIIKPDEKPTIFNDKYKPLALVGADLFNSHYENLNRMLRRRSKWLVPHSKEK